MSLSEALLPEFDNEIRTTRRCIERVPTEKFGWKPHDKSHSMGDLASHLANLLTWAKATIESDSYDVASGQKAASAASSVEVLALFDKNAAEARAEIAGASDETLMGNWTLKAGDKEFFTMPRMACLRSFVLSHLIHHRGQLSVYLRLNEIPVPAIYGPSGDENPFG